MRTSRVITIPAALLASTILVLASPGAASAVGGLDPGERRCFDASGEVGAGAIVNLTPVLPAAAGDGQLVSSDLAVAPTVSNVNYRPGEIDPNVAIAPIGLDHRVCFVNSVHSGVHLVADHLGSIGAGAYDPAAASGGAVRSVDTRIGLGGERLAPSDRRCFEVAGEPGDAAIVNLTPVRADAVGNGLLVASDVVETPVASNVNFAPGTVDPNVAVARIGVDGRICFVNSDHAHVDLVADHLGNIAADAYTPATTTGAALRRVDTRIGLSGGRLAASERRCFDVDGEPGDAAIVNLTPVRADGGGNGQLVSSDVLVPPAASNVNFRPGRVDPNIAVATIGADGAVCFVNSVDGGVDLVADHLGTIAGFAYEPASASGAPVRRVDTRLEIDPVGYLDDVFNGSLGRPLDDLLAEAAPGSPAELYARHQLNIRFSHRDVGVVLPPDVITEIGGGVIRSCAAGDDTDCGYFGGFVAQNGRIRSFGVGASAGAVVSIDARLGGAGPSNSALGLAGRTLTSYRTAGDVLFVTIELSGSRLAYVDLIGARYLDAAGHLVGAVDANGIQEIVAGSRTIVYLVFDQVGAGGTVLLPTGSPSGDVVDLRLSVPSASFG